MFANNPQLREQFQRNLPQMMQQVNVFLLKWTLYLFYTLYKEATMDLENSIFSSPVAN
jgi:hypothetical protein